MDKYWINQGDTNVVFWAHEFSKHATCTSTFDVSCYGAKYKKHQEVIDFYDAVIRAFKMYPTYDMLAAYASFDCFSKSPSLTMVFSSYGIVPSNKTTYSLAQIQTALTSQTGAIPYLGCTTDGTVLSEVWYMHHVLGSVSPTCISSSVKY